MPELTVEGQLACYGRAAEARALEPEVALLAERGPSADRRWFPAAAALIIVLGLAAAVVAIVDGEDRPEPVVTATDGGQWETHTDAVLGWRVDVPPGWRVLEFEESCWQGFAVVNHDTPRPTRDETQGCATEVDRFAPDPEQVAVVVYRFTGSRPARTGILVDDTEFPLSLSDTWGVVGIEVVVDGEWTDLHVRPLIRGGASPGDRAAAEAVVASLVPPWLDAPQGEEELSEPADHPEYERLDRELPGTRLASEPIQWVRTDGERDLVVSFMGALPGCYVGYSAEVTETPTEVILDVAAVQDEPRPCRAMAHGWVGMVRLEAPLAGRTVRDGFGPVSVADHTSLLVPRWLPDGYGLHYEHGDADLWTRRYALPKLGEWCVDEQTPVDVVQGPPGSVEARLPDAPVVGTVDVGGAPAEVREGTIGGVVGRAVVWSRYAESISVETTSGCFPDGPDPATLVDLDTLVRVAENLS